MYIRRLVPRVTALQFTVISSAILSLQIFQISPLRRSRWQALDALDFRKQFTCNEIEVETLSPSLSLYYPEGVHQTTEPFSRVESKQFASIESVCWTPYNPRTLYANDPATNDDILNAHNLLQKYWGMPWTTVKHVNHLWRTNPCGGNLNHIR